MSNRIYICKRYQRFWHWSQALLIITMMITGLQVHGSYLLLGFKESRATAHPPVRLDLAYPVGLHHLPGNSPPANRGSTCPR